MIKRALLRGKTAIASPDFGVRDLSKSVVAVLVYVVALPFVLLAGKHRFMQCLIRACDHLGKILACLGLEPIKEKYITE